MRFPVESDRQPMIATGITQPVMEWTETPDGKRRPSDVQARDEDTGFPVYGVEVLYTQTTFGRESTVTAMVTLPCETEPAPQKLAPVAFTGLEVEIRTNKAGGITETWFAEGFADTPKATPAQPTSTAGKATTDTGSSKAGDKTAEKSGEKAVA